LKITIKNEWDEFYKRALTCLEPGSVQYLEMRKAFYTGFCACLLGLRDGMTDEVSEEQGVMVLQDLITEYDTFIRAEVERYNAK
jgi:Golgi nucleoside diphosphatase